MLNTYLTDEITELLNCGKATAESGTVELW